MKFKIQSSKFNASSFFIYFSLFLCYSAVFICLDVSAQEHPPQAAAPREAQIPQPFEKTLKNGLRVIVVQTKNVPLVTAELIIKSGGEVDPKNLPGAADMTAELLTKGTRTRTASKIAEEIEFIGGTIEAGADWDYSSIAVRALSDKIDKAMAIMADVALNPVFSPAEITRYKTQLLDQLSVNLKQPATLAGLVADRVILSGFMGEVYAHPLTGTPESIKRIRRADLINLHRQYYKADNAVLVVAGDISPNSAFAMANKYFGAWAKTPPAKPAKMPPEILSFTGTANAAEIKEPRIEKITVVDLPDAGQAAVLVGQPSLIGREDEKYFAAQVANSVFGGGYSSRLNQEIRIRRGLSYGAGSDLSARRIGGIFAAQTLTKNESAAEVAQIIVDEFRKLANRQIEEAELTPRKLVVIGNFSRDLETTNGIVRRIGELALYNVDLSEINRFIQNVQQVGDASAREYVRYLFRETAVKIVIVGEAKMFLPDLQKRFPTTKIEVIAEAELDLNREDLRKAKSARAGK
ncbi:MAG: insulinase family protein [Acidobacteriota bacterium]|nr:insulinase family protein [Acidobacteriota bacterium]